MFLKLALYSSPFQYKLLLLYYLQLHSPTDLCLYKQSAINEFIQTFIQVQQRKNCIIRCWCAHHCLPINRQFPCQGCCMSGHTCSHPPQEVRITHSQLLMPDTWASVLPIRSWAISIQLSVLLPVWPTERVTELRDQYYRKLYFLLGFQEKKINIKPTQCSEMSTYCLMDLWNTTQCLELPLQLQKCKVFFCVISKHQLGAGICIYFTSPSLLLYVCLLYLLCCMSLFLSSNFLLRTALTEKK